MVTLATAAVPVLSRVDAASLHDTTGVSHPQVEPVGTRGPVWACVRRFSLPGCRGMNDCCGGVESCSASFCVVGTDLIT